MAEVIKKKIIKIRNGNLKSLCRKFKVSFHDIAMAINVSDDLLIRFNRGERTLTWEKWVEIGKYLDTKKLFNEITKGKRD